MLMLQRSLSYNRGSMTIVLLILTGIAIFFLLVLRAMRPMASPVSGFELERRKKQNDMAATVALSREKNLVDIASFLTVKTAGLLVVSTILLIVTFGWLWGVVLAILLALFHGALARLRPIQTLAQKWYRQYEPRLEAWLVKLHLFVKVTRNHPQAVEVPTQTIASREELSYVIQNATQVLSEQERATLMHVIHFPAQQVRSVMTPRNVLVTIDQAEFLGPLVLDELHAKGHSRLPVTDGDIDHIIGILHLSDLLSLDNKKSATAKKMMHPRVYYIHEDDSLEHALAAFLDTRHHLFIVINSQRETVGLLTLEDVLEALLGRDIVDEDDNHANLRAVAERAGKTNNTPPRHVDL